MFSVAEVGGQDVGELDREFEKARSDDPEAALSLAGSTKSSERARRRVVPVGGISLPFFHVDLEGAVESAVRSVRED